MYFRMGIVVERWIITHMRTDLLCCLICFGYLLFNLVLLSTSKKYVQVYASE
jgi:hypothetical protein